MSCHWKRGSNRLITNSDDAITHLIDIVYAAHISDKISLIGF